MTLKDLINNGLVGDDENVTIVKPLSGSVCDMRKGNWLNEQVQELSDAEISAFSWDEVNGYSIALKCSKGNFRGFQRK